MTLYVFLDSKNFLSYSLSFFCDSQIAMEIGTQLPRTKGTDAHRETVKIQLGS